MPWPIALLVRWVFVGSKLADSSSTEAVDPVTLVSTPADHPGQGDRPRRVGYGEHGRA